MRVERIGDATLYLGDCRDLARQIVADAVISDPPYGINYNHSGAHGRFRGVGVTKAARSRGNHPIVGDDSPFDPSLLLSCSENVLVWGADHYRDRIPATGRWLAFDKLSGMEPWDSFSDVEFGWHSKPGASRIFSMKWKGIACDKRGENNGLREHPTQKPIALMMWCIQQAGAPERIFDPYMGSGTTGVAALRLARKFVGIEIDPGYFDIACRRIEAEARQPNLFREPAVKPSQARLFDPDLDSLLSYNAAVKAVGEQVKAGAEVPPFFQATATAPGDPGSGSNTDTTHKINGLSDD